MSCLACKNKLSLDRCERRALSKLPFCGVHMKSKHKKTWIANQPSLQKNIVKIQALCRGFLARLPIRLAGPGVLKRSICNNDEDLVTVEEKDKVHPHDYFAIEEDGKIWWFDQRSMLQWAHQELDIKNPYTRTLLSKQDMKRLRKLWNYRRTHNLPLYHAGQRRPMNDLERRDNWWLRIAQVLREHEFELHHQHFISLNFPQMMVFVNTLAEDMRWWHSNRGENAAGKYALILVSLRNNMPRYNSLTLLSKDIAGVLLCAISEIINTPKLIYYINLAYHRSYGYA